MAKQEINYLAHLDKVLENLYQPGLLLVTQGKDGKPNPMIIGWGTVGIIWGKPCFVVLVRPSRHSFGLMEEQMEFTVNVLPKERAADAGYCGSNSGRDSDKLADCGLTAAPAQQVSVPIVKECVIHYECRVVHHNDLAPDNLSGGLLSACYPEGDYHRLYYGEIVACYADEDAAERL